MGNTSSAGNSENEDEETGKEAADPLENEHIRSDSNFELSALFEPKQLRIIADNIKDDAGTANLLQQHKHSLVGWLEEKRSIGVETVTLGRFVDSFTNKVDVSKQTATEMFHQFDVEGDGVVDLEYLDEMMDLLTPCISSFTGIRCDIQTVNKILQDCRLSPGFIDGFTSNKTVQLNHGQKLFKFLFRNRAFSTSLALPALKRFITTTDMRLKGLKEHLRLTKQTDDSSNREPYLQADVILEPISRCFTSVEVSSNHNDASKLIDNDNGTYWQSNGNHRTHWVKLKIPQNVIIKQLSMYVVSSDRSYMPHHIIVYGGRDESNLQELKDVSIPNHITGDFTLLENVKVPYQLIQISVNRRRFHRDGSNTRIRQIKAIGYKVVKSEGVSIMDATAMWYLSVLAATAQAALPAAPNLRNSIISYTRKSLSHMVPLSLSPSSSEKPGFLTTNVMEQMETFLHSIICMHNPPPPEDVAVLLEFSAARGSLGSILDVLELLLKQIKVQYPVVPLLKSLSDTEDKAVRRHAQKLITVVLSCDGGTGDGATNPTLIISDMSKTESYVTAKGKTRCNVAFGLKSRNLIQLTRVFLKLSKGAIGPKAGMIFVFDSDNIQDESGVTLFEPLKEYNSWTQDDYNELRENARGKKEWKSIYPVAYFSANNDRTDVDVAVDRIQVGSNVIIKFLGPRQDTAEQLGIIGIDLFGYEQGEDNVTQQNKLELQSCFLAEDKDACVPGDIVLLQTLNFLQVMCGDAVNLDVPNKDVAREKHTTLDIYDVTTEQIWNVYKLIDKSDLSTDQSALASEMVLNLFHIALPYLCPNAQNCREQRTRNVNRENIEKEYHQFSTEVFQALCDIVDEENADKGIHKSAKAIIHDGAALFFPDAKARRAQLLSLVHKVMEDGKAVSLAYTFQSLCRFFRNKDATGLLGLPHSLTKESFQPESVIPVMKTLVSVAYRESLSQVKHDAGSEAPSNLVLLLCTLQESLLTWCYTQCSIDAARDTAFQILLQYVDVISDKCNSTLVILENATEKVKILDRLENSFVSKSMRQLVLFLNLFSTMDMNFISIIRPLQTVSYTLSTQLSSLPELFSEDVNEESPKNAENTVLREWEVESEHDYENDSQVTKVFNCTGCSTFRVEFDSRCQTEQRVDYLEFTDSSGCKRRFNGSVGTDQWPSSVEFIAGQCLHFLFHSDCSNTAWGYKFKVFAIGNPDVAVNWAIDLQLNLARCFGIFCGNALNSKSSLAIKTTGKDENEEERALLHSELWGSLFRGGYMIGKLERSLSGFHKSSPFDSNVNNYLCELAACDTGRVKGIAERCRALYTGQKIGGGELLDSAVNAAFAALLWHTQELREQVSKVIEREGYPNDIPAGILLAYRTAESIRRSLMESRQKLLVQLHKENDNVIETVNPDTPIISCREKSLFLLKFAGLSNVKPRKMSTQSPLERRNSSFGRPKAPANHEHPEVSRKGSTHTVEERCYPSFQMIIDFITNVSLSHIRIQDLLRHRCTYAKTVANIYTFAFEYMKQIVDTEASTVPVVLFLQNMLTSQDFFPQHYSDYLNGCGLSIEKNVRKSFYSFLRQLAGIVEGNSREDGSTMTPLFKYLLAYLLHFLDVEWKPYDFDFVAELNIPYILVSNMQGMTLPVTDDGKAEIQMLEKHKQLFKEVKDQGIVPWCDRNRAQAPLDIQRDINLFLSRYYLDLELVATCDGCKDQIKSSRYRCLRCVDMDLCYACYMNGAKPNKHSANHKTISMQYICAGCNAFIIETRIHCNSCIDFDLCLSCHRSETYPTHHTSSHIVTKTKLIPEGLAPVKVSQMVSLKTHVQQHSWLQFCALALSLSESMQSNTVGGVEAEYVKAAEKLLLDCLERLVCSLSSCEMISREIELISSFLTNVKIQGSEKVMSITPRDNTEQQQQQQQSATTFQGTKDKDEVGDEYSLRQKKIHGTSSSPVEKSVTNVSSEDKDSYFHLRLGCSSDRASASSSVPILNLEKEAIQDKLPSTCEQDQLYYQDNGIGRTPKLVSGCTTGIIRESSTKRSTEGSTGSSTESKTESSTGSSTGNTSESPMYGTSEEYSESIIKITESDEQNGTQSTSVSTAHRTSEGASGSASGSTIERITDALPAMSISEQEEATRNSGSVEIQESGEEATSKERRTQEEEDNAELYFQERILGLVAAIIPQNKSQIKNPFLSSEFKTFFSTKLLPIILKIVSTSNANIKLRMISLGIMVRTLHYFGPEVGDTAVRRVTDAKVEVTNIPGSISIKFLFFLGAECLKCSDLDAASGVEGALKRLSTNDKWRDRISSYANELIEHFVNHSSNPSQLSLFCLMLVAGFPDIFYTGSLATLKGVGGDVQHVVVVDNPRGEQTVVINFKNRKRLTVKESNIEPLKTVSGMFEITRISLLVRIVTKLLSEHTGCAFVKTSAVQMWVIVFVCKALLNALKTGIDELTMLEIIHSGIVPSIINLACQETGFSKQWMLQDLEVLSWTVCRTGGEVGLQAKQTENMTEGNTESTSVSTCAIKLEQTESKLPLDGLDEETKVCMDKYIDKLLEEGEQSFDGNSVYSIRGSNELGELAKQWKEEATSSVTSSVKYVTTPADSSVHIGVLRFHPQKVEHKGLHARPESAENPNKQLSSVTEEEIDETTARQRRIKSAELLQTESESTHDSFREYTRKVNYAVAVGYARQLVGWLFASWPETEVSILDNIDPHNIVGILGFIQVAETKTHFRAVVHNFIRHCSKQLIQPLALLAVHYMGEFRRPQV